MVSRLDVALLALAALSGGCSLLSLDVLQGEGTGGASASSTSATALSTGAQGGDDGVSTVGSGDGDGAAGGEGGGGGSAQSTSTGEGGAGDPCSQPDVVFCDDFDDAAELDPAWDCSRGFEIGSTCTLTDDPVFSSPRAARVFFGGPDDDPDDGQEGGFVEIERRLPGSPAGISLRTQLFRDSIVSNEGEGVLELGWGTPDQVYTCIVQVLLVSDPPLVQFFAFEYGDQFHDVQFGDATIDLPANTALDQAWIDLGFDVELGDGGGITTHLNDVTRFTAFDGAGAECDDGPPEDGSWYVSFGAVYNYDVVTLTYDDIVVREL